MKARGSEENQTGIYFYGDPSPRVAGRRPLRLHALGRFSPRLPRPRLSLWSVLPLFLLAACSTSTSEPQPTHLVSAATSAGPVRTGAQVLADSAFRPIAGKRIGLIVNHTALVDTMHLIDVLHAAPNVEVAALFGPEHGLRGTAGAGEEVAHGRDVRTGIPIYSLYGETRKPTPQMLEGLDALVFDIQDVGARFYTYITTMGLAMQAAAEAGIPFVVLDRPNPVGGTYVSGFVLEPEHASFVGRYPIPIAHGMTVGELARMIVGEGLLPGLESLQLEIVPMQGWHRDMLWPHTGLPWVPTSPNIPDFTTALVYPGAALFEAASASEGRGTKTPFKVLGAPWADAGALVDTLHARNLPGVRFEPVEFTPRAIAGMAPHPKLEGETVQGIRYVVTNNSTFRPVETGIHVLHAFHQQAVGAGITDFIARPDWLAKLAGTDRLYRMLTSGARPEIIVEAWRDEVERFREARAPYLLY